MEQAPSRSFPKLPFASNPQGQRPGNSRILPSPPLQPPRSPNGFFPSCWNKRIGTTSSRAAPPLSHSPEYSPYSLSTAKQQLLFPNTSQPCPITPSSIPRPPSDYHLLHREVHTDGRSNAIDGQVFRHSSNTKVLSSYLLPRSHTKSQRQPHTRSRDKLPGQEHVKLPAVLSPSHHLEATTELIQRKTTEWHGRLTSEEKDSPKKLFKKHVTSACLNCKRAHLACDFSRPCRRCLDVGKADTCFDVQVGSQSFHRLSAFISS